MCPTLVLILDRVQPLCTWFSSVTKATVTTVPKATVTTVPNRPPSCPTSYMHSSRSSLGDHLQLGCAVSLANLTVLCSLMPNCGTPKQGHVFNESSIVTYQTTASVKYSNFTTRLCGTWVCGLPSNNLVFLSPTVYFCRLPLTTRSLHLPHPL